MRPPVLLYNNAIKINSYSQGTNNYNIDAVFNEVCYKVTNNLSKKGKRTGNSGFFFKICGIINKKLYLCITRTKKEINPKKLSE